MLHIENPLLTKACQPYTSYLALGREGKINKRLRLHPFAIHFPTTGRDSVSVPIPPGGEIRCAPPPTPQLPMQFGECGRARHKPHRSLEQDPIC